MVVAELVERSPLTKEIHGSNPDITKIYFLSSGINVLKRRK